MNMRDYSILYLDTNSNSSKKQCFYCCSAFHSHSRVFNNEQNSLVLHFNVRYMQVIQSYQYKAHLTKGYPLYKAVFPFY